MGTTSVKKINTEQKSCRTFFVDFYLVGFWLSFGWRRAVVHLSGFMSHPAIYPLHRQERIEYIKICFTEITKIWKKPRGGMPNKGFFAAQPSGAESINPGANIVWGACGALITLLHPLPPASVTNINQNNSDKRCNKKFWHMTSNLTLTHPPFCYPQNNYDFQGRIFLSWDNHAKLVQHDLRVAKISLC